MDGNFIGPAGIGQFQSGGFTSSGIGSNYAIRHTLTKNYTLLCSAPDYSWAFIYMNNGGNNQQGHALIPHNNVEYPIIIFSLAYSISRSNDVIFQWTASAIQVKCESMYDLNFYIELF